MAVSQVVRLHAAPGRFNDLLERNQKIKRIRERLAPASRSRTFIPVTGNVLGELIVVIEFESLKELGEFRDRMEEDPEARALLQSNRSERDPLVVSQTIEVVREI